MIILAMGLMSCQELDLTFDQSNAFIAFENASGALAENAVATDTIGLYYASTSPGPVSVTVGTDATGISNPAVEGVDFNILTSKSLSFASELFQVVVIQAIDNDVRDNDKSVYLTLTGDGGTTIGMGGGANATYLLTIQDNEHPLAAWIGTYTVDADSYGDVLSGYGDGDWDEQWTVTTAPVAGDETKLSVVGMAYGDLPVEADVDVNAMTITFPAGADVGGSGYGYDATYIWKGNFESVAEEDVVGTINPDGSMDVDLLTMIIEFAGDLYLWDSFNTTWTPAKKKSAPALPPKINKLDR